MPAVTEVHFGRDSVSFPGFPMSVGTSPELGSAVPVMVRAFALQVG